MSEVQKWRIDQHGCVMQNNWNLTPIFIEKNPAALPQRGFVF